MPNALNFERILDSDFSEDDLENKLTQKTYVNRSDSMILMSFRLPVAVRRHVDGSLYLVESQSPIYPTIFKLKK